MMEHRKHLIVLSLSLLAIFSAALGVGSDPCDPKVLARLAWDCVGGLEKPRLPCCEMIIASVGIGYGDEVPCLCRVVADPDFIATGLNIYNIIEMYPVCQGVHPVGPRTADACKGNN